MQNESAETTPLTHRNDPLTHSLYFKDPVLSDLDPALLKEPSEGPLERILAQPELAVDHLGLTFSPKGSTPS